MSANNNIQPFMPFHRERAKTVADASTDCILESFNTILTKEQLYVLRRLLSQGLYTAIWAYTQIPDCKET